MFFHKPFYMEPTKGGGKAYTLLREALRATGKVGIAKVVIKTREYLAAVKPNDKGLVLELMHFADELIDSAELHVPDRKSVSKGEMEMAQTLIRKMTRPWEPKRYKDDYKSALLNLIEKKIKTGGRTPAAPARKARPSSNVIDLMEVLRKSLGEKRKTRGKRREKTKARKAA